MAPWFTPIWATLALGSACSFVAAKQPSANCSLSDARLRVPANQTQLIAPSYAPSYIALGVGTQNYTCNATSYVLEGALAELFDISCLYGTPLFDTELPYTIWEATNLTAEDLIVALVGDPLVLGQHLYVPNPTGSGLSPEWDFIPSTGNPNAYVIGSKVGDLPSSDSALNIDDLMIKAIAGDLASLIFRVQTHGGQPPTGCSTLGSNLTVKYTAQYWFFGGNITQSNA